MRDLDYSMGYSGLFLDTQSLISRENKIHPGKRLHWALCR
jgi:hypothetical protein